MPEKETVERAQKDAREGKSPSTQAGEFVREEMHHVREGKHGARSTKQAIAIGLSKARRAGVKLQAPRKGKVSARTREQAGRNYRKGQSHPAGKPSARRSRDKWRPEERRSQRRVTSIVIKTSTEQRKQAGLSGSSPFRDESRTYEKRKPQSSSA
jgi:hypothetical protein